MQAAGATILAFPQRARPADVLELRHEHRAPIPSPPTRAADRHAEPLAIGRTDLAPNLLLAVPYFLSPQVGTARDLVAVAIAVLIATLATRTAAFLPGLLRHRHDAAGGCRARRPETLAMAAVALLGALAIGHGLVVSLSLFGLLEIARQALGRRALAAGVLTVIAVLLRLDAGATAIGVALPPLLAGAGLCLGLFAAARDWPLSRPRRRWAALRRDLVLLALAGGTLGLYSAALQGDAWVQRAGGAWPLMSVPLLLLALLRLWRTGPHRAAHDPWLIAAGLAWAGTLGWTLPMAAL